MKKYLVTGAAGFIGYYLAKKLSEDQSNYVYCVDNFSRGENDNEYRDLVGKVNVEAIELDLSDKSSYSQLPLDVDYIFHMAAMNGTQNFYERPMDVLKFCTLPTIFLIEHYAPVSDKIKRFVFAGTSESYASTVTLFNWDVPTDEKVPLSVDDPSNVRWSYAASKIHGEVATYIASDHYKMPVTVLRFHNAYGPRMGDKHVVPDFLERAKNGVYELYGYENTRSFLYIDDVIEASLGIAFCEQAIGEIVNIGGELEVTMLELGQKMMEVCSMEGEITLHPAPAGSVLRRLPDVTKLKTLINFEAKTSLDKGLALTAEYYLNK